MEYRYVFCITNILLTQFPSHSTIAYTNGQRTHRRHIDSTYNYWETGLKEASYRTFLRKGYADPSLKDQIINAPLVVSNDGQTTPFGDVAVLARGQLFYSAGGFLFVQDEKSYDCDECEKEPLPARQNYGQIVALWTVKRLRHHDNSFHRYETEYLVSPVAEGNYLKKNGDFDYDIPGYVFILKTPQKEQGVFRNYLPQTPFWYDNKENSRYLPAPYKEDRRYLPPSTTETPYYYTVPNTQYKYHEHRHYYDPDIIPARNNVEKEIELYNKLLESLKTTQSTTTFMSELSIPEKPSSVFDIFNRVSPVVPPSSTMVTSSIFDFPTTSSFLTSNTQNVRFPQTTPFRPSPMYTRYSEPDPLYTTSTTEKPIFYTRPMEVITTTTARSAFFPSTTDKSTPYSTPVKTANKFKDKTVFSPETMSTTSTESSTFYRQPIKSTTSFVKSPEKSTSMVKPMTHKSSFEMFTSTKATEKSTTFPKRIHTIITSTEKSTSYETQPTSLDVEKSTSYTIPATKIITAKPIKTKPYLIPMKELNVTTEKSMKTSTEPSIFSSLPVNITSSPTEETTLYSTSMKINSTLEDINNRINTSTLEPMLYQELINTTGIPKEKSTAEYSSQPIKTTEHSKGMESTILWTTYVAELPETALSKKTSIEKYQSTQPPLISSFTQNPFTTQTITTPRSLTTAQIDFNIFDIFDKPKKMGGNDNLERAELDRKESIVTQMILPKKSLLNTFSYVNTTQPSVTTNNELPKSALIQENSTKGGGQEEKTITESITERYEAQSTNYVRNILKNKLIINEDGSPTISKAKTHKEVSMEVDILSSTAVYNEMLMKGLEITTLKPIQLPELMKTTNAPIEGTSIYTQYASKPTVETSVITKGAISLEKTVKSSTPIPTVKKTPIKDETQEEARTKSTNKTVFEIKTSQTNKSYILNKSTRPNDATEKSVLKATTPMATEPKLTSFNKRYKLTTSLSRFKTTPRSTTTVPPTRKYKYTKIPKRKDNKIKKFNVSTSAKTSPYTTTTEVPYVERSSESNKKILVFNSTVNEDLENLVNDTNTSTENVLDVTEHENQEKILETTSIKVEDSTERIQNKSSEPPIDTTSSTLRSITEIVKNITEDTIKGENLAERIQNGSSEPPIETTSSTTRSVTEIIENITEDTIKVEDITEGIQNESSEPLIETASSTTKNTAEIVKSITEDTIRVEDLTERIQNEISEPPIETTSSTTRSATEIVKNITEDTTLETFTGNQITESTIYDITTLESTTSEEIKDVSILPSDTTVIEEESFTELTTPNQLQFKLNKASTKAMPSLATKLNVNNTTQSSNKNSDDIFGMYTKSITPATMATMPSTMRKNNVDQMLEEELFGTPNQKRQDNDLENQSTQGEEITTQVNTPKIIFDNFYEASTSPSPTTNSKEEPKTTASILTTTMCSNYLTQVEEMKENQNIIAKVIEDITAHRQKFQNENLNKDYEGKETQLMKIIIVALNESQAKMINKYENDTIKAKVTKIDIDDDNFAIYKAEMNEKDVISDTKQNTDADLFERLALSVVNNARSIDYLNRKKLERKRRRKVYKQKIRRKEKTETKS